MTAHQPPFAAELTAALQWWELAGVTYDFADDATDWLAEAVPQPGAGIGNSADKAAQTASTNAIPPKEQSGKEIVQRVNLLGDSPPSSLSDFQTWWLEVPGLDAIGPRGRIAPRGVAAPQVMVLVPDPEAGDSASLLSGPQGRLLSNMLRAMGLDESQCYIASALPRHTPMADTVTLGAGGMDAVTLHHLGLVSPQKLLVFGSSTLPLLGRDVSEPYQSLREINYASSKVPTLVSEGLDSLLGMPQLKARFWRRWMEWSSE